LKAKFKLEFTLASSVDSDAWTGKLKLESFESYRF
jgi:hypothetical protein